MNSRVGDGNTWKLHPLRGRGTDPVLSERSEQPYLISGRDLWMAAVGDVVCLFFCTLSLVRAFFSFSFSRSLSFFSFFFLSTCRNHVT